MNLQEAFKRVEQSEEYIVELLRQVVAVDTSVPPGENYGRLIDLVEPDFRKFGFETERVVVPPDKVAEIPLPLSGPRENLVACLKNGRPRLSAYAHMDVVPVEEAWTRDPFGGEIVDGKLYGRGTVDMKYAIACFLGAVKVLHEMGVEPRYGLECLLCTDEEVGIWPGARYLAEQGYFTPHLVWMELGAVDPVVVVGAAGSVSIRVTGKGRSCHSGMNWMGVNAIEEMVPVMQELLVLKKEVEQRLSRISSFPMPGNPFEKMTPMFNLDIIHAGTKENIVPSECTLTINRRYIVEERYDDLVAEIEAALKRGRARSKLLDLQADFTLAYTPVEIDPDTDASKRAREAMTAVCGYPDYLYGGISGSTDLGFVVEALKPETVQVASFGVIRASDILAHAADEFVYIEDLLTMTKELVYYFAA